MRISKRVVDGIQATGREHFLWDDDLTGFGVRVSATGAASYVVAYRAGSGRTAPKRRVTIASVGKVTPEEARKLAKRTLGDVAHGLDPADARARERKAITLRELIAAYLDQHVRPKRAAGTAEQYRHVLETHLVPALGARRAADIARAEIARLHLALADTPYAANRLLAVTSSLFSWAGRQGLVDEDFNPATKIERFKEERRERFLSLAELERLGAAIREGETVGIPWEVDETKPNAKHAPKPENRRERLDAHAAAAIRLLLFTGARLREILHLRWEEVDLERGLLLLPASKTGRKTIVLNAPALAVLNGLPRASVFVIRGRQPASPDMPERPRADLQKPWEAIRRAAGLGDLRIHDLRHTFASYGAGSGMGLPIIGRLLGHTQAATTARYAHLDADPLRKASEAIAGTIAAAVDGASAGGEIVRIQRGAKA